MSGALYPMGVVPQDFPVGTPVRWYLSEKSVSPYIGRVTHIVPATNKVWVAWPIGYPTQHDPSELIIVPPEQGISPINVDYGNYNSYEKQLSEKAFGTMNPQIVEKLASRMTMRSHRDGMLEARRSKLAGKIASSFSSDVVGAIKTAAEECKAKGLSDLQAYGALYSKFASRVSDDTLKESILSTYE